MKGFQTLNPHLQSCCRRWRLLGSATAKRGYSEAATRYLSSWVSARLRGTDDAACMACAGREKGLGFRVEGKG